ncbi:unnamed protein product, partial [Mycena citricolor]
GCFSKENLKRGLCKLRSEGHRRRCLETAESAAGYDPTSLQFRSRPGYRIISHVAPTARAVLSTLGGRLRTQLCVRVCVWMRV